MTYYVNFRFAPTLPNRLIYFTPAAVPSAKTCVTPSRTEVLMNIRPYRSAATPIDYNESWTQSVGYYLACVQCEPQPIPTDKHDKTTNYVLRSPL